MTDTPTTVLTWAIDTVTQAERDRHHLAPSELTPADAVTHVRDTLRLDDDPVVDGTTVVREDGTANYAAYALVLSAAQPDLDAALPYSRVDTFPTGHIPYRPDPFAGSLHLLSQINDALRTANLAVHAELEHTGGNCHAIGVYADTRAPLPTYLLLTGVGTAQPPLFDFGDPGEPVTYSLSMGQYWTDADHTDPLEVYDAENLTADQVTTAAVAAVVAWATAARMANTAADSPAPPPPVTVRVTFTLPGDEYWEGWENDSAELAASVEARMSEIYDDEGNAYVPENVTVEIPTGNIV